MQLNTTNIHIMHEDPVMTAGLRAILGEHAEFTVSSHAVCPHALSMAHVIVADYQSGIAAARQMPQDRYSPAPRVLIVTQFDKEWEVRMAMDSGVHGYLLQGCSAEELVKAARLLSQGLRYLSEAVTRCVADSLSRETLTGRETDVLRLLAQGCCNKSIARELGIGVGTVKTHVKGLMSKLDATARTHAVVVATQRGLIGPGQQRAATPKSIMARQQNSGFHNAALQ
jgi:DNA-binding NarL/FixJ family response regulator